MKKIKKGVKNLKHVIKLDRRDILCAIEEYLLKQDCKPQKSSYYTWVDFKIGKIDIGIQREPQSIETVVGAECVIEG